MSNSVQPHRRQPTRLLCPWDSLGKNTGVGCHFLLQWSKVKSESEVAQSGPTLWPHGLQPTRLLRPWDFPGKSTGGGFHFPLQPDVCCSETVSWAKQDFTAFLIKYSHYNNRTPDLKLPSHLLPLLGLTLFLGLPDSASLIQLPRKQLLSHRIHEKIILNTIHYKELCLILL